MILTCLKSGLEQMWANKRMVLVFYLANLFFGLLLMLPMWSILDEFVGFSLTGAKLGGRLDMDFLFEFLKYNSTGLAMFSGKLLIVPAFYWLFALFLSGGAFAVFVSGDKYRPALFWGRAAKFFGRFLRLLLWSLPVLVILFILPLLEVGIRKLIFGNDPYQYITYWGRWITIGLGGISILLFGLVFDYARIHAVQTDERRMRKSLWRGIKFAFGKFSKTFGLALTFLIVGGVALAIYNPMADILAAPKALVVVILFLLQQVYIFFRMMLRLNLLSSQLHLYRAFSTD